MTTKIIAKAVLVNGDKFLALKRSDDDERRPGEWDLPGGNVEEAEGLEAAVVREIEEEAGLAVNPLMLHLVYSHTNVVDDVNRVWLMFLGRVSDSEVTLSQEHSKAQWMTFDEAIKTYEYQPQVELFKHIQKYDLLADLPR